MHFCIPALSNTNCKIHWKYYGFGYGLRVQELEKALQQKMWNLVPKKLKKNDPPTKIKEFRVQEFDKAESQELEKARPPIEMVERRVQDLEKRATLQRKERRQQQQ